MDELDQIVENIRTVFDARNQARDEALAVCRLLTRHCANAIRAVHREETLVVNEHLQEAGKLLLFQAILVTSVLLASALSLAHLMMTIRLSHITTGI